MDSILITKALIAANLVFLTVVCIYLLTKVTRHRSVPLLLATLIPLFAYEMGSFLFVQSPERSRWAYLILLGAALLPISLTPLSHTLGRDEEQKLNYKWLVYYAVQILILAWFVKELLTGQVIEWVTGILDQPIILIDKNNRFFFINTIVASGISLLSLDSTVKNAGKSHLESLKFIIISLLGLLTYFVYVSVNVLISSYISQSMLSSGAAVVFIGLLLLLYSFAKYPFWEVKVLVSRKIVFGCLSVSAGIIYLIASGSIIDLLRLVQPQSFDAWLPAIVFILLAVFLLFYLSPNFKRNVQHFVTKNFFRNKYDYRALWMQFSEKSSGSLNLKDSLPKVTEFIANAMFVRPVAVWLRSANSGTFFLAHCHEPSGTNDLGASALRLIRNLKTTDFNTIHPVPVSEITADKEETGLPISDATALRWMGIQRIILVDKGDDVLAIVGIGAGIDGKEPTAEDEQFLTSVSNQLGHLILTHKISDELLLAREWESFNRFASFILHDLKNLATLQGMTLENAKSLRHKPEFLADAFATFNQTTDKMINLIASLSVQRGQFSLKQQPVNVLEVIANTFDDLKVDQRDGLRLVTEFPPKETPPIISGDPELLQKAFTNLLLNAIQSLPKGEGAVEITVSSPSEGKILAAIKDTGCGIPPEQLQKLFRPFQTTKRQGMGIGLCHTRSIIEVHGGQISIESEVNTGTKVELVFPSLSRP